MARLRSINGLPVRPAHRERATAPQRAAVAYRPSAAPYVGILDTGPNPEGECLFPYQVDGARWLRSRDRALLADEMGLGKTAQILRALPGGVPVIVVCPASLRLLWRDQCEKWRPDLRPIVSPPGDLWLPGHGQVGITSYESLPEPDGKYRLVAANLSSAVLVVDEAHYAKNWRAARTKKLTLLARQCGRSWFATGTPLAGRPQDLWGVLGAAGLAFEAFDSVHTFRSLFGAKKNRWGGVEFPRDVPGEEEVRERLSRVMLRRRRADVLPDLPSKVYQTLPVEAPEDLVGRLNDIGLAWQDDELPPFEMLSEVRAELARSRIPALLQQVESYEEEGIPLVVFSAHREPILSLAKREGWGLITGDTPHSLRQTLIDAFETGLLCGLALTIQAGGVGITLTRASHALFVDLSYTPADNAQAEDRMARIGQKASSVQIARMVADHPVDKRVLQILDAKQRLIQQAIGG